VQSILSEPFDNKKALENELKERVKDFALSPSSMDNYLNCPRQFLYRNVLKIEVKEGNQDFANYGRVVHLILQNAADYAVKNGHYRPISEITRDFENILAKQIFSDDDMKQKLLKRGTQELGDYYPKFTLMPPEKIVALELDLKGLVVGENMFSGKIDRIDKNENGTYSIYDYKTGSAPSDVGVRADGPHKTEFNQLCFYKWAYEKSTDNKVSDATLVYLKGSGKNIRKTLDDADMARIEELIIQVHKNIRALNFEKPEKPDCKYCEYTHLCKLEVL
jgi:CRISPR/Cas system-associated exonuclease Cas4 (RecB family)